MNLDGTLQRIIDFFGRRLRVKGNISLSTDEGRFHVRTPRADQIGCRKIGRLLLNVTVQCSGGTIVYGRIDVGGDDWLPPEHDRRRRLYNKGIRHPSEKCRPEGQDEPLHILFKNLKYLFHVAPPARVLSPDTRGIDFSNRQFVDACGIPPGG